MTSRSVARLSYPVRYYGRLSPLTSAISKGQREDQTGSRERLCQVHGAERGSDYKGHETCLENSANYLIAEIFINAAISH